MIEFDLPFPVSTNQIWRKHNGRMLLSKRAREFYRECAYRLITGNAKGVYITDRVHVDLVITAPDKRSRDLDNLVKSVFDAMTKGGFWEDDKLVRSFSMAWSDDIVAGGNTIVKVSTIRAVE